MPNVSVRIPILVVVVVSLVSGASTGLGAPSFPACAPLAIPNKIALIAALRAPGNPERRAAAIAGLGQPGVRWAYEIAIDTPPGGDVELRAAALQVLRFARWREAVPRLTELGEPYRREWVIWNGALNALVAYPYTELQPFWRELLSFPRRNVRELALRGIAISGDQHDLLLIREATHQERDAPMLALLARTTAMLALPIAVRDTLTFAWPPDSTGRFVPSASFLRRAVLEPCPDSAASRRPAAPRRHQTSG